MAGIPADAIVGIVFGLLNTILIVATLWQNHFFFTRHLSEIIEITLVHCIPY